MSCGYIWRILSFPWLLLGLSVLAVFTPEVHGIPSTLKVGMWYIFKKIF